MVMQLRKPILVGGVGLSVALWLWSSLQHSLVNLGELGFLGAIALGSGAWWWQKRQPQAVASVSVWSPLDRQAFERAIAQTETAIAQLEQETSPSEAEAFTQELTQLSQALNRQQLQVAIAGGSGVGKTSIRQAIAQFLPLQNDCVLEASALFGEPQLQTQKETNPEECILASDLVLFVVNGDLTDSEFQRLQRWQTLHQRILIVFNKQDRYVVPEERALILQSLKQRCSFLAEADVVAVAASPAPVKVRKHLADGSVQEWMETPPAEIEDLEERLGQILASDREQLVLATTWRLVMALKTQVKVKLNHSRRTRALPVVERYQWVAAAAAFANPVATLDLLATAAVNAQLVIDLGAIYQQKFSWQQAQTAAGTLGKLMVQLGLVELSTQTVGSLLKSHAMTYVAGGAVQGISAAYLTRLAGLSLIEYLQEQEISVEASEGLNLNRLGQKLQQVFGQNQRTAFLQSFVKQAAMRLSQNAPRSQAIATQSSAGVSSSGYFGSAQNQ